MLCSLGFTLFILYITRLFDILLFTLLIFYIERENRKLRDILIYLSIFTSLLIFLILYYNYIVYSFCWVEYVSTTRIMVQPVVDYVITPPLNLKIPNTSLHATQQTPFPSLSFFCPTHQLYSPSYPWHVYLCNRECSHASHQTRPASLRRFYGTDQLNSAVRLDFCLKDKNMLPSNLRQRKRYLTQHLDILETLQGEKCNTST